MCSWGNYGQDTKRPENPSDTPEKLGAKAGLKCESVSRSVVSDPVTHGL